MREPEKEHPLKNQYCRLLGYSGTVTVDRDGLTFKIPFSADGFSTLALSTLVKAGYVEL